jgi:P-aminobenzoate N-oxygenase AurF
MNATVRVSVAGRQLPGEELAAVTERLNHLSVVKRHEAYRDIDWDGPDCRVDPFDPRFRLSPDDPLGSTDWYRSLPEPTQASLGLDAICQALRYGIAFESCLSRGLLEFVETLPPRCPQYRYAMHEVVEESHHSMMFREFIDRSGCQPAPLPSFNRLYNRLIVRWASTFPELFFFHVLSGEIFVDQDNRARLARREEQHPLVRRMMHIHVVEEARHVRFAEAFLRDRMPRLPRRRRWQIRAMLPIVLDQGERMMLRPLPKLVRQYAIPARVLADAFGPGSAHESRVRAIVAPVYGLLGPVAANNGADAAER